MSLLQPVEGPRPRVVIADDSGHVGDLVTIVLDHRDFEVAGGLMVRRAIDAILADGCDGVVEEQVAFRCESLRR